jgi:5-oxopent-3-ene-1,2,5-tricarboxylate decarboxylase/2-hydroxyhepta-2,4-diene-1,7-dioate isomerase
MDSQTAKMLDALRAIPAAAVLDVLESMGYTNPQMVGVRSMYPGQRLVGRAVTMRFVPSRPDMRAEVIGGTDSAEYRAMELCGPGDVLIMDAMGWPDPSAAGDIKLFRLAQRGAAGVVTDGGVRDLAAMKDYGIGIFAAGETNRTMPSAMLPCDVNVPVKCGGILVLPGDYITADDGGVVVLPHQLAAEVVEKATEFEEVEQTIKRQLAKEDVSPGTYYPFNEATWELYHKEKGD